MANSYNPRTKLTKLRIEKAKRSADFSPIPFIVIMGAPKSI